MRFRCDDPRVTRNTDFPPSLLSGAFLLGQLLWIILTTIPRHPMLRLSLALTRDSILWRKLAVVLAARPMVDATRESFRRVAYSASVGLDAFVMAWCTEIQTGKGRVVVNETAAGGKSGEASNTIFRGYTPCYTNYSCTGLSGASQWSWPVWCSVVCYVCGAPLGVVSEAGSSPTTFLPPWEGLRSNQAINDIPPSRLAFRRPVLRRIRSRCQLGKTSIVSPSRSTFSVSVRRDGSGTAVSEKLESEVAECGEVGGALRDHFLPQATFNSS
jgi:hypothetical protein